MIIILTGCARQDAPALPQPAPVATMEAPPQEPEYIPSPPFRYGRSLMEGEAAALYDQIWAFLSAGVASGVIPIGGLTGEEAERTATIFRRENPIYYWAEFTVQGGYVRITYTLPPEEVARQRAAIEARAAEILDPIRGASHFEIALAIHDTLAIKPYSTNELLPYRDNIYGTLVRWTPICGGFASAFLYLTELAGIESVFLVGNSQRGISHAWNAVMLDGSWHFLDVTWNRPTGQFDDVFHSYFLIDERTLLAERYWDKDQFPVMPETGEGFQDFFQRMGYSVSGPVPHDAVDVLADIFFRQLIARPSLPTAARPVFLELRVSDSPEVYADWKDIYIRHLFDILRAVHARAVEEDAGFIVADLRNISIDYNDIAQVLVFYPIIRTS